MSNTFYAIRHIPTGYFIPEPRSEGYHGYTHVEPKADCVPRLMKTKDKANRALTQWLRGTAYVHTEIDTDDYSGREIKYACGTEIATKPDRIASDMEVVEITLTIKPKD